jgi:Glycerate kinase family
MAYRRNKHFVSRNQSDASQMDGGPMAGHVVIALVPHSLSPPMSTIRCTVRWARRDVYAPQKGANPDEVVELDRALRRWADVVERATKTDHRTAAGAGAADAGRPGARTEGLPTTAGSGCWIGARRTGSIEHRLIDLGIPCHTPVPPFRHRQSKLCGIRETVSEAGCRRGPMRRAAVSIVIYIDVR